jgi:hypothetical protein
VTILNGNMTSYGRGNIPNLLNKFMLEFIDVTPAITLMISFGAVTVHSRFEAWSGLPHIVTGSWTHVLVVMCTRVSPVWFKAVFCYPTEGSR